MSTIVNRSSQEIQSELDNLIASEDPQDWYHRFEIIKDSKVYTPGRVEINFSGRIKFLEYPNDFYKGKRILDIGAYSGAFSFFLEDLGADVVALDVFNPNYNGFNIVHQVRKSSVKHINASVYDLNPSDFGYFDIVAFYGVFYHLKHPLLAFERINSVLKEGSLLIGGGSGSERWFHNDNKTCQQGVDFQSITKELIADESVLNVDNLNQLSLCGFSESHFLKESTNWFIPNQKCLEGWLKTSGFSINKIRVDSSPIKRPWNVNKVNRSSYLFKSFKIGLPVLEYSYPNMKPYTIPTDSELQTVKQKLEKVQKELELLRESLKAK